ncbi:MAG: hypothetical protein FWH21_00510, partial [Kiritimatiellaeota bacterium]|nr:hypothetical protein [Kiritimatiellota bacterium]
GEEGVREAGVYVAGLPYLSEQAGDGVSIGEDITLGEAASSGIYDVRIGWETSYASHVYHDMKARHGAELEPPVGPKDAQQRAKWMEAPGGGEDQELNGLVLSIYSQAVQNAIAGIGSVGGGGQLAKLASRQKTAAVRAASPQRAKQALAAKLKRYGLAVNPNGGYMPAWMSK